VCLSVDGFSCVSADTRVRCMNGLRLNVYWVQGRDAALQNELRSRPVQIELSLTDDSLSFQPMSSGGASAATATSAAATVFDAGGREEEEELHLFGDEE
jgi:hypothetical protein